MSSLRRRLVVTAALSSLLQLGCAHHPEVRLDVDAYLASKPFGNSDGAAHDILLYPAGIRHDENGRLIVDCVAEGPVAEARLLAQMVQVELREWPSRWIQIEHSSGRQVELKAPKHSPYVTVCYFGVDGFVHELPNDRARVLAQRGLGMWNPFWNDPSSYRVRLLNNEVQMKWAERHGLRLHVDTRLYEFEIEYITVIPNPVLPHGLTATQSD